MSEPVMLVPWQDPNHPSNKIRPRTRCWGCNALGCVGKHWGDWCFACNVKRMTRLSAAFDKIREVVR